MKEISLIQPDFVPPAGKSKKLVDDLVKSWRMGRMEGAGEIGAIADFLTNPEATPNAMKAVRGGPIYRFLLDFIRYLKTPPSSPSQWIERVKKERGWGEVPLAVVATASATGGLTAALTAAGVAGGEVITASYNYVGVVAAIVAAGGIPRFVDIDPQTWCMDPAAVESALCGETKAIVLTHVNRFADLDPFEEIYKRRGLEIPLVQDASLAVASTREGVHPGLVNLGEGGVTVMSFTVSKIFSGMGGGVICSNSLETIELLNDMVHQGVMAADPSVISCFGMNSKMSALNALVVHELLKRRERIVSIRRDLAGFYAKHLAPLIEDGHVAIQDLGDEAVVTHYGVVMPPDAKSCLEELYNRFGIHTGMWHAHHSQELYKMLLENRTDSLTATNELASRIIFFPFHTAMGEEDVAFVCKALAEVIGESKARPSKKPSRGRGAASSKPARRRPGRPR